VKKKAAVPGILLLASLSMAAFQSLQFHVQTIPNQAVALTAVSTPPAFPSQTPDSIVSPIVGARQWLRALNTQDDNRLQTLTCQAQQEKLKEGSGWAIAFPALAKISTSQLHGTVAGLSLEIMRQNEEQARIRVYGNLVVTGSGSMGVYAIDERWWMVYEDGVWHWCGTSPGEATPTLTPTITSTPWPITRSVRAGSSSSPSFWQVLGVILAILGGIGRIYSLIRRNQNKTG
jgi:hypothetical protein